MPCFFLSPMSDQFSFFHLQMTRDRKKLLQHQGEFTGKTLDILMDSKEDLNPKPWEEQSRAAQDTPATGGCGVALSSMGLSSRQSQGLESAKDACGRF